MMTEQMVPASSYHRLERELAKLREERMTVRRVTIEQRDGSEIVLQVVDVLHTPEGVYIKTR